MCENFKFESELKVSFCLSGSSLHEDHQVYVYVSTFYQLINSHIKRTQWQYCGDEIQKSIEPAKVWVAQLKYFWILAHHMFGHHWAKIINFIHSFSPKTKHLK